MLEASRVWYFLVRAGMPPLAPWSSTIPPSPTTYMIIIYSTNSGWTAHKLSINVTYTTTSLHWIKIKSEITKKSVSVSARHWGSQKFKILLMLVHRRATANIFTFSSQERTACCSTLLKWKRLTKIMAKQKFLRD